MSATKVDDAVVDQFTNSDCWLLAWELHTRFGFDLVLVLVEDSFQPWNHVVVKVGEDAYMDVEGVHTGEKLIRRWNEFWGWDEQFRLKPMNMTKMQSFNDYHHLLWNETSPCSVEEMLSCDKDSLIDRGIKVLTAAEAADVVLDAYAEELTTMGVLTSP